LRRVQVQFEIKEIKQGDQGCGMVKCSVTKRRGYPDRRGMGAQSDYIAEQFVPSEGYKAQQIAMVQRLTAAGANPEQLEKMFFFPVEVLLKPGDEKDK
jgi:hypothetical protein